jgi:hypothetical protein
MRDVWRDTPAGVIVHSSDSDIALSSCVSTPNRARHPDPSNFKLLSLMLMSCSLSSVSLVAPGTPVELIITRLAGRIAHRGSVGNVDIELDPELRLFSFVLAREEAEERSVDLLVVRPTRQSA